MYVYVHMKWIHEPNAAAGQGPLPAQKQPTAMTSLTFWQWYEKKSLGFVVLKKLMLFCLLPCPVQSCPFLDERAIHYHTTTVAKMGTKLLLHNSNSCSWLCPTKPTSCYSQLLGPHSLVFGFWQGIQRWWKDDVLWRREGKAKSLGRKCNKYIYIYIYVILYMWGVISYEGSSSKNDDHALQSSESQTARCHSFMGKTPLN